MWPPARNYGSAVMRLGIPFVKGTESSAPLIRCILFPNSERSSIGKCVLSMGRPCRRHHTGKNEARVGQIVRHRRPEKNAQTPTSRSSLLYNVS